MRKALLMAVAALGLTMSANAEQVTLGTIDTTLGGFIWNYSFAVAEQTRVDPGDYFTIYDFAGWNGFTSAPSGWTFAGSLADPESIIVNDNPLIPDVSFQRTGGTVAGGTIFTGFQVGSTQNEVIVGRFASQTTDDEDVPGSTVGTIGSTQVPRTGGGDEIVPEPSTYALLGSGLAALALVRRSRK